jgi:NAD(P)-dependent dehydrogenase (short-subunit alcohol dehydrogenase family)
MGSDSPVSIVTGANSGIGLATATGLAREGHRVIMACRNLEGSESALEQARTDSGSKSIELMQLDLASQASIRDFATAFSDRHARLSVLVNNAGVIPRTRQVTQDGFEAQFGVNHLGPFLLTHLLLERLKESAPARIVTVSSIVHHQGDIDFDDLQSEKRYGALNAYRQSKLANILFTYELARRLEGTRVTANCLHPGVVDTGIARDVPFFLKPIVKLGSRLFLLTPEKGAATTLLLATSPDLDDVSGKFYSDGVERNTSAKSKDEQLALRLWEVSEELTGIA